VEQLGGDAVQAQGRGDVVDQAGPAELLTGHGVDVRPHPHIGLGTVTYLFQGDFHHRDSTGADQIIRPGALSWMVAGRGDAGRRAGLWIVALIAGVIGFPFIVAPLDSLMLSLVAMALFVLGLGAMVRAGRIDPRAAMFMAPGLAWLGFSAFVGLSFAAAWSPPFAVTNSQPGG